MPEVPIPMKAVILSAGQGSRLLPLTEKRPKCLLPLDQDRSVLEWQLRELADAGIREAVVVVGFESVQVEAEVANLDIPELAIRTFYNPFYKVADNLSTCWMVRHEMECDFLLLNGDTVFEAPVAERVLQKAQAPITVTIDRKAEYDADDMKVHLDRTRLLNIGKSLPPEKTDAESIGMLLFRGDGPRIFRDELERIMRTQEGLRWWYLKVIDQLARSHEVGTVSIEGLDWGEVDYHGDLELARAMTAQWTGRRSTAAD